MIKTKLFAIICSASSVVVAATTALTLAVSGPRNTQSLRMLSDNNAVAYGIENLVGDAGSGIDTVSTIIDTITNSKTSLSGSFTINSIQGINELEGIGAGFTLETDVENKAASLLINATLSSVEVGQGTIYLDSEKLIAELPFLFEGIMTVPIDNLEEDMANSYIGQLLLNDPSFQDMIDEYESFMDEFSSMMTSQEALPQFDFDYEAFYERLSDTVEDSFDTVKDAMEVSDLGDVSLNGGSYQGYRVEVPVKELSYILRDVVVFMLTDEELLDYIEDVMEYYADQPGMDFDMDDYSEAMSQLSSSVAMIKSAWGMVVTEIENVVGKSVGFEMYLTDAVELAGFDVYVGIMDSGRISFDRSDATNAAGSFSLTGDLTGGKDIGDYADIKLSFNDDYDQVTARYLMKHEANGDFTLNITAEADDEAYALAANGSYTSNNQYFDCTVDSLKGSYNGETMFDVGFSLSFKPVNQITKPSGSPEYNLWEMDEADFMGLGQEMNNALMELMSLFN